MSPVSRGRRRFQRILRFFAEVLAFGELGERLGNQEDARGPAERTLTLFMLALWHNEEPREPSELSGVRQAAHACIAGFC